MDPVTLLLGVVEAVTGSISALLAIWGVAIQLRHVNTAAVLRKQLSRIERWSRSESDDPTHQLLEALDRAAIIAGPLRQRLLARFVLSLLAIGGLLLATATDLPGQIGEIGALEPIDIMFIGLQILVALVNRTPYLLDADSREFLRNLEALQSKFFTLFVVPAMREFNRQLLGMSWLREALKLERREAERMRDVVREEVEIALTKRST